MKNDKKNRFSIIIATEECKACGKCVVACPKHILSKGSQINSYGFRFVVCTDESACIGCGNCFYSCPEPGAITIYVNENTSEKIEDKQNGGKRDQNTTERK